MDHHDRMATVDDLGGTLLVSGSEIYVISSSDTASSGFSGPKNFKPVPQWHANSNAACRCEKVVGLTVSGRGDRQATS